MRDNIRIDCFVIDMEIIQKKKIFVTVGTTKFDELIQTVLSPEILEALSSRGYNKIILQIGKSSIVPDCTPRFGFISIDYFKFSNDVTEYVHTTDLVISHAGAGSILDALEAKKHLIVVANESLMDNHQLELAEQLYIDKHLYYCNCKSLLNIIQIMDLTKLKPFVNARSKSIARLVDDIMGFN